MERYRTRESSFELLRIVAQWMIVLYHLLYFYFYPYTGNEIYKTAWLPLHIGVVLYVLISGYFGIHASTKGLISLLVIVAVYTIPLYMVSDIRKDEGIAISSILFVSKTPFWFVRTYLYLYLLSPIINRVIYDKRTAIYLLLVLSIISIYIGTVGSDHTLRGGKDILNFTLIYIIGHELRRTRIVWEKWHTLLMVSCFLSLNILVMVLWYGFNDQLTGRLIWRISFPYNSPLLIVNAVLLFVLIGRFKFKSVSVNYIAASSFAIYLIHTHPFVRYQVLAPICSDMVAQFNESLLPLMIAILSLAVIFASIMVDKALTPLWSLTDKLGLSIENKMNLKINKNED